MNNKELITSHDLQAKFGNAIRVGINTQISADTIFELEEDAFLAIGNGVTIMRGTTIQVSRHATVQIEDDVAIGEHVFLSALIGICIGKGVGISNMVDIHDVNHRTRTVEHLGHEEWTPWASGFAGAPIVIESGAIISNKCSITAGVRVGYNSIVGANSVVTRSIPPNSVAAGAPATVRRAFEAIPPEDGDVRELRFGLFGTSIMEHLEGYSSELVRQWDLPQVGTSVAVESWQRRGYAHRLYLALQTERPHLRFSIDSHAQGGYTSRDLLAAVKQAVSSGPRLDVAIFECGINDVWRRFQGRITEAVDRVEYKENYQAALQLLSHHARRVICISQTPVSPDIDDALLINNEIRHYNQIAGRVAEAAGVAHIDVWELFRNTAQALSRSTRLTGETKSVWSDGIHLSEYGDTVLLSALHRHLEANEIVTEVEQYELFERSVATAVYQPLFARYRV